MASWIEIDRDHLSDGSQLILYERDGAFMIRAGGLELMTTQFHRSEEAFVTTGLEALAPGCPMNILIGGLGFGYTLAQVLKLARTDAQITVAEISSKVIAWNKDALSSINGAALSDPRTKVIEGDLMVYLKGAPLSFDLALLDIDNGPEALVHEDNNTLYSHDGLENLARTLTPRGVAVFWSAVASKAFEQRLLDHFCCVHTEIYPLPQNPRIEHVFFIGREPRSTRPSG
jgi:spermidine synthase